MPKKLARNQAYGFIGESEFKSWAEKMGWFATKLEHDVGIDFICQIRGNDVGAGTWVMPGNILCVSVRSVPERETGVRIDRNDAELFFSSSNPIVLALVRRAPIGRAGLVAIKIPDELFLEKLEGFLNSSQKTKTIKFSEAIENTDEIQKEIEKFFQIPYQTYLKLNRIKYRLKKLHLKDHIKDPQVDIKYTGIGAIANIHLSASKSPITYSEREALKHVVKDLEIGLEFPIIRLDPNPKAGDVYSFGDVSFESRPGAINSEAQNLSSASRSIEKDLSLWNYNAAFTAAEKIEQKIGNDQVSPDILFLIGKIRIIRAERQGSATDAHVRKANEFLIQADEILSAFPNETLAAEIEALRGSIENLENGNEAALARLAKNPHPYATRIRLAILLNREDWDRALVLIDEQPLQLLWCDLAIMAYLAKNRLKEALDVVDWVDQKNEPAKFLQCVVRLAISSSSQAIKKLDLKKNILTKDIHPDDLSNLREVVRVLGPVITPMVSNCSIDSELATAAVQIALQVYTLVGDKEEIGTTAKLLNTCHPVPKEVAASVVNGYLPPPKDLSTRLRKDYPDEFEANFLALVVDFIINKKYIHSFADAKKLVPLASTDVEKEKLFKFLHQIWQEFDGDAKGEADCKQIAASLITHNPNLLAVFNAAQALRAGKPKDAIKGLDDAKAMDDPFWLQLKSNALFQLGQLAEAAEMLIIAADSTDDPKLLHQTAELAFNSKKTTLAIDCYKRLLLLDPKNLAFRSNLAYIYWHQLHDVGKALTQLQALYDAEPDNQMHTRNLAICLAKLYRPKESLTLYDQACDMDKPDLGAILGRSELQMSLGDPDAAFASLQEFRDTFWDAPGFISAFMNVAYCAGKEDLAHEALVRLHELHADKKIKPEQFRSFPNDEALEMIKQEFIAKERWTRDVHSLMLIGKMPWIWAAEACNSALYWAWRTRTEKLTWIGDDPLNRAQYCIYATNGFHAQESAAGRRELLPLECPPKSTRVAIDLSALITLHRLGILEKAADFFGEILIPEGYLATVLDDGKKMVLHQRSRQQTAEHIEKLAAKGTIQIYDHGAEATLNIKMIDEYNDTAQHPYRLTDLIQPIYEAGLLDEPTYERIAKLCSKPSGIDDEHPALTRLQNIQIESTTLETITTIGLLKSVSEFYRIQITQEFRTELLQRIAAIEVQDETRQLHFDLWNRIVKNPRFKFVNQSVRKTTADKDTKPNDTPALYGVFVAKKENVPLLTDDRVTQVISLNERKGTPYAAFGTDTLICDLEKSEDLPSDETADAILQLIQWRYRFILPPASILKNFSDRFRNNLPGRPLREIAEYVHDCMRDEGLFTGPENTDLKESMAAKLYLSWCRTIADLIMLVWDDEKYTESAAKRLTEWCINEFLPSNPRIAGHLKTRLGNNTARVLFAHASFSAQSILKGKRVPDALKAMKEALQLSDEEYHQIMIGILNVAR